MSLKKRFFIAFFITILVPVVLMTAMVTGAALFQSGMLKERYGIDVTHLQKSSQVLVANLVLTMVVILIITALILSFWLYSGISSPLTSLTRATKNIRDGNMDFELTPEGNVTEIRGLFESFEEMRVKLKEANEEKVEFDRQSRELISNISHDLRTPITTIRGYCEGIMDGVADTPEKLERYIRTIYTKTTEMDHLINELSFYTKISTNRIPYNFGRVDVREFYGDAAGDIRDDLESKGVTFSYKNDVPEGTEVIADVEQITRVLNNIIGNAVKYTDKEEKRIDLSVELVGDEVRTAVTDNGKGIAAKDLASIFDRFYRTDSSRNSAEGGSGIGLSIVKKVVEDHGGRVWATSKEGEGSTFYFALRVYRERTVSENDTSDTTGTRKRSGSGRKMAGRRSAGGKTADRRSAGRRIGREEKRPKQQAPNGKKPAEGQGREDV